MDDRFVDGAEQIVVVAGLDLCLDRVWCCRAFYSSERPAWCEVSCYIPCGCTYELWTLWELVVHI